MLAELAEEEDLVLATGGGAVLHEDLWPRIRKRFLVVWLHAPEPVIVTRLAADSRTREQRPSLTGSDPAAEAARVLAERRPLYQAASHVSVDSTAAAETVAEKIIALFQGNWSRGASADAESPTA